MNRDPPLSWSQTNSTDPMTSAVDDDFSTFLDLGSFSLDLQAFDEAGAGELSMPVDVAADSIDTCMVDTLSSNARREGLLVQGNHNMAGSLIQRAGAPSADVFMAMNLEDQLYRRQQQQQQQQQAHQQQAQQQMQQQIQNHVTQQQQARQQQQLQEALYQQRETLAIPPTPNSVEMHGGAARFLQQLDTQSNALMDNYQRKAEDQMVFTPLVSPAVIPLDSQYAVPDYAVPGGYFSPITSPALDAQPHSTRQQILYNPRRSDISLVSSPIDRNFEFTPVTMSAPSFPTPAKKTRRAMSSSRPAARVIRQSPAMKPQRRKVATGGVKNQRDLDGMPERHEQEVGARNQNLQIMNSHESSASESISPEPLSDILMAPPPAPNPGSANRSPYLMARSGSGRSTLSSDRLVELTQGLVGGLHPATPASLMRLETQPIRSGTKHEASSAMMSMSPVKQRAEVSSPMEDLTLPEAAKNVPRANLFRVDSRPSDGQTTQTSAEEKTPQARPLPLDSCSIPPSPATGPHAPPMGFSTGRTKDVKHGARRNKSKRNSVHSIQVSPALMPKISPGIKPLLPDGAILTAQTSALLLASKSNYQNILEGNHLPGVIYPEALSTNLTSKRTSHKIAEQGRRNRINNALQEIASLLPASSTNAHGKSDMSSGGEAGTKDGPTAAEMSHGMANGTTAQQSNSKASTVEMAIDYIRQLQSELAETKGKLDKAEMRLCETAADENGTKSMT